MKKKINIILLIFWMIIIFLFSSQNGSESSNLSDGVIETTVKTVSKITGKDISEESLEDIVKKYVFFVRKNAHFFEYLILGILVINVIKDYKQIDKRLILIALLFCILYSISDEIHQMFVPGRSSRVLDVLIDSLGSSLGIGLYTIIRKRTYIKK